MCADDMADVGCPEPAAVVERMLSAEKLVARSERVMPFMRGVFPRSAPSKRFAPLCGGVGKNHDEIRS